MKPKLNIVFEISSEDDGDSIIGQLLDNLSMALGIEAEFLTGDISMHKRLTISLLDGRKIVIQSGDTDDHFVAVEN